MVEPLLRRLPVNQVEALAVMFQVAAYTIPAIRIPHLHAEVITVFVGESLSHFPVAIETFKGRRVRAEDVARAALRCSRQRGMRLREWSRRNLRLGRNGQQQQNPRDPQAQGRRSRTRAFDCPCCQCGGLAPLHQSLRLSDGVTPFLALPQECLNEVLGTWLL